MAYSIPENALVMVSCEGKLFGQQVINTFAYRKTDPTTNPDGKQTITDLLAALTGPGTLVQEWANCMSISVVDLVVTGQMIAPARYTKVFAAGVPASGAVGDEALTPNTAVVITRRGELANRRNLGNIHVPGVPFSYQSEGEVTEVAFAQYAELAGKMTEIINLADDQQFTPVIFNREQPSLSPPAVSTIVQRTIRVMDRRTVGRGA